MREEPTRKTVPKMVPKNILKIMVGKIRIPLFGRVLSNNRSHYDIHHVLRRLIGV
jgi:hypothetical protein